MPFDESITENIKSSLAEIPHPAQIGRAHV